MYVGTRVWVDGPQTLYPGDVIEGTVAIHQVTAGNAEELKDDESESEPEAEAEAPAEGVKPRGSK
jgi:hypothetical protein